MRLRIATFNVENLVSRNVYGPKERPQIQAPLSLFDFADPEFRAAVQAATAVALEDDERQATALAIAETRADILCLQEVDSLGVLAPFLKHYVHAAGDLRYGHMRLVPGNDPRGIDVAFCARRGLVADEAAITARSWSAATYEELGVHSPEIAELGIAPDQRVFNRDCLEVDVDLGDRGLTLFICHLKSTGYGPRSSSPALRAAEARAVRAIVERRFGAGWREALWIVAGDFNDGPLRIRADGGLVENEAWGGAALTEDFAIDPVRGLVETQRWTYHFRDVGEEGVVADEHVQLDHVLLSPALAAANPAPSVEIIRRGLPYRVPLDPAHPDRSIGYLSTRNDRYPRIGWDRPRASDHCPLVVEIDVPKIPLAHTGSDDQPDD